MRTTVVIPIKQLSSAKSRLRLTLPAEFCASLMAAMARDVLTATRAANIDGITVVTGDAAATRLAAEFDAAVVDDRACGSHSEAAALGAAHAARAGSDAVLMLAGDCPLIRSEEIDALLGELGAGVRRALIVSDREGTGTNALALSPPTAIAPAFGPGSCERHLACGLNSCTDTRIARSSGIEFDIDTPQDLLDLRLAPQLPVDAPHTAAVLADLGDPLLEDRANSTSAVSAARR